jgi:hypothetical protein
MPFSVREEALSNLIRSRRFRRTAIISGENPHAEAN